MDHCRTLRKNWGCDYSRIKCIQKVELKETLKLERTELCLLGKEFRDASPAAFPLSGNLETYQNNPTGLLTVSVIWFNLTGREIIFKAGQERESL